METTGVGCQNPEVPWHSPFLAGGPMKAGGAACRTSPRKPSWALKGAPASSRELVGASGTDRFREAVGGWEDAAWLLQWFTLCVQGTNGSQVWDTSFAIQALLEVRGCFLVPWPPADLVHLPLCPGHNTC